ncbi:hypothetical protein SAMN05421803_13626 [Nocardiopsis flavescens]|uniref:Uncharacterized protein n=1 Tax=Nocardiopsis flavescens TaxID=758803 RepID=A0A1M6VQ02_9ACTN|nr:hypothetical protein [Nocardiopsis flavescens]SHK83637.1 hypothetical protein SAMN05421803_13626 [Nocardiopsis flavescens]
MSPRPAGDAVPEEPSGAAARPAPAPAAEDFGAALNGGAPAAGEQAAEKAQALPADAVAEPAPQAAPDPEEPGRRVGSVVGAEREAAAEAEPALDRPGAPMLAGAAIAGLILVAAPFAVVTGTGGGPMSLDVMAGGEQVPATLSGQGQNSAQSGGQGAGESGSGSSVPAGGDGGGSPVTDTAPDTGYVPEVRPDVSAPAMPDPGDASGGSAVQTSTPGQDPAPNAEQPAAQGVEPEAGGDVAAAGAGDTAAGGDAQAGAGGEAGAETGTGTGAGGEAGADTGAAADAPEADAPGTADGDPAQGDASEGSAAGAQEGRGDEAAAEAFSDQGSGGADQAAQEGGGAVAQQEGAAAEPGAGVQDPGVAQGPVPADGGGDSSVLNGVVERFVPVEDTYMAVAGPGCPTVPGASYGHEGRWGDGEEGTAGWATRPGGYGGEDCAGEYDAIPVSGDPERGNGQYAVWSFNPGREGVSCELYVHVPDDESPLWLAPGEARYLIRPGVGTEQPPVAVFGFDQSQIRGGWVQVTGFVTPAAEFTVELTNAGADPLAETEGTSAHVAASAVRSSCS